LGFWVFLGFLGVSCFFCFSFPDHCNGEFFSFLRFHDHLIAFHFDFREKEGNWSVNGENISRETGVIELLD